MNTPKFSTAEYGTGKYWHFDNGQFAEKTEIKLKDHYELQIIHGKVTGLYFHQSNNTGNSRINSACFSIHGLSGKRFEIYKNLLSKLQ